MNLEFYKYQGAGNDFILLDNRKEQIKLSQEQIESLCDRHFGIGADGLMLLNSHWEHDFEMVYFNSDGKEGSMCGNGGRCIVRFAFDLGIIENDTEFIATDGKHHAHVNEDKHLVKLKMIDVNKLSINENETFLNTGSPHHISFEKNIDQIDVNNKGKEIRDSKQYAPNGTNVNFVEYLPDTIKVRTFERGVENETLACGTGAVASAISVAAKYKTEEQPLKIEMPGGTLFVYFNQVSNFIYNNIWLEGPANRVFKGQINIS